MLLKAEKQGEDMNKSQIIIVTNTNDSHADDVVTMLGEMGHEPIRLNTDDIPQNTMLSLGFESNSDRWRGAISVLTNGRRIDVEAIRSIWWRRPSTFGLPIDLSEREREFATDEIEHVLQSLWRTLREDCYWISYPEYIRQASFKGSQLQQAAKLGFEVPRTLITTDPEEARAFYEMCNGKLIYKVLSDPFLGATKVANKHPDQPSPAPYGTHTTLITESEVALLDSVRAVPCLFQEYVPKQVELRVTVIGNDIFAAEIYSQEHEKTQVDWRHYDVEIPYRKATLPTEIAERCLALVKSSRLNFSTMDLILTPDGHYVFIENNPNGQFIFIEHRVPELRMTEALASCLLRAANS